MINEEKKELKSKRLKAEAELNVMTMLKEGQWLFSKILYSHLVFLSISTFIRQKEPVPSTFVPDGQTERALQYQKIAKDRLAILYNWCRAQAKILYPLSQDVDRSVELAWKSHVIDSQIYQSKERPCCFTGEYDEKNYVTSFTYREDASNSKEYLQSPFFVHRPFYRLLLECCMLLGQFRMALDDLTIDHAEKGNRTLTQLTKDAHIHKLHHSLNQAALYLFQFFSLEPTTTLLSLSK